MEVSRLNAEIVTLQVTRAEYVKLQMENSSLRSMLTEALQSKTKMESDYKKEIEEMQYVSISVCLVMALTSTAML